MSGGSPPYDFNLAVEVVRHCYVVAGPGGVPNTFGLRQVAMVCAAVQWSAEVLTDNNWVLRYRRAIHLLRFVDGLRQ